MTEGTSTAGRELCTEPPAELDRRLRLIEGQVRGVRRMLGEGRGCAEVLGQLTAAVRALDAVRVRLAATHLGAAHTEEAEGAAKRVGEIEAILRALR